MKWLENEIIVVFYEGKSSYEIYGEDYFHV